MSPFAVLLSFGAFLWGWSVADVTVETGLGKLKGSIQKSRDGRDFYSFTSVPYAKPPLGRLRLKAPEPVDKWEGVLDATGFQSPRCFQSSIFQSARKVSDGQEDCLYLSVATPKLEDNASLPVMVYIHGGGFKAGDGGSHSIYKNFMDHDIVLVSVSYRLGALGFLSTEDDVIPGNFGLKDQALALRWVKDHIRNFGGDPEAITIFGPSAGGASVHYHLMSPLSKGLIKGGISESGVASSTWGVSPPGEALSTAIRVAESFGCPTGSRQEMLECFRAADAAAIAQSDRMFNVIDNDPIVLFSPVVESKDVADAFITEDPFYAETHLPWIQGITSSEGSYKITSLLIGDPGVRERYLNEFEQYLPSMLMYNSKNVRDEREMTSMLKQKYFSSGKATLRTVKDIFGDGIFLWPSAVAASNHKGPQWYYYFDHRGQSSLSDLFGINVDLGVWHVDELIYLFNMKDVLPNWKDDPVDRRISDELIKLWVNFAKYGDPTPGEADPKWEQHGAEREYLHMQTEGFKMKKNLLENTLKFWNSLPLNWNRDKVRDEL